MGVLHAGLAALLCSPTLGLARGCASLKHTGARP